MRIAGRVASAGAALLAIVLLGTSVSAQSSATERVTLDVPFLPQTEDLCGGATAAMLFRYWGDRHASVRQFEPLVDHSAGGIADVTLIDAIRQRQWTAERLNGSEEALRAEIEARRPPMLLIEDRPGRYHYVIAVGIDTGIILLHDPTWGPARKISTAALTRAWRPTNFWMLRVTPGPELPRFQNASPQTTNIEHGETPTSLPHSSLASGRATTDAVACDARVEHALDEIDASGLDRADEFLLPLTNTCAGHAAPWRELAGVRFAQRRWSEASSFALDALAREPHDRYAADVLGSSRFMLSDFAGALRAWNRIDRPTLDTVKISGLTRTRYALLVQALGLEEEQLLRADAFDLARRRLESLPDLSSTRLALRPDEDHFAVADIAVVERATLPHGPIQWAATTAQAALERQASLTLPGRMGQGEVWSTSVGWWKRRPRVGLSFAAPLTSGPRGVWQVDANWAAQEYGPAQTATREEQFGGSISFSTWLTPGLRTQVTSGIDRWTFDGGARRRMVHVGASIEHRFRNDHIAATASAERYVGRDRFSLAEGSLVARTSHEPRPFVLLAGGGVTLAGSGAPLALWNGAGDGRTRTPLLRAHQLLDDGRIDGPVFGRTLAHATLEAQHWFAKPQLLRVGAAAFLDAAHAGSRPDWSTGSATQADIGIGLRLRVPGRNGAFRVDYAHGTVDGARAWFIGWQTE